jgi:hypothetical protein
LKKGTGTSLLRLIAGRVYWSLGASPLFQQALASSLLPETQKIIFGEGGGVFEIRYAATGFLYTKRQVYLDIQRKCELPVCNLMINKPQVPFFMTMVVEEEVWSSRSAVMTGLTTERGEYTAGTQSVPYSPTHHYREAVLVSVGGFCFQPSCAAGRL